MRRSALVCLVVGAFFTLVPVTPLFAQGALAEVNGTAVDQSGAVLPGASVRASGPSLPGVRKAVTDSNGRFRFPALTPGPYTVRTELYGFRPAEKLLTVSLDASAAADFVLEPSLAECAAVAVLRALERRILPAEAKDLEAQLPRRLVDFLPPLEQRPQRPRRFGKEEFLQTVADDLEKPVEEMEPVVRAVFRAMRDLISEGEANDVASNLPPDLQALWRLTQ